LKIICLSDTHGFNNIAWRYLESSDAEMLIFAGDFSGYGTISEAQSFDDMLQHLPMKYKIVVAGNHDFAMLNGFKFSKDIIYLEDSEVIINGLKIYGSPWSKLFRSWCFMISYDELQKKWQKIPDDTNILVTHTPPFGILDYAVNFREGDEFLVDRIKELKNLKLHIFGHIHESYGMLEKNNVTYVNCSMLGRNMNKPIEIEL